MVAQGTWGAFERPDWLDPRTKAFAEVAATFYRAQSERFGDSTMYKMDLLHEGGNPGDVPVDEAARAVEAALQKAHPGAVWAILGWQNNPSRALLDGVDKSRMLIVDGLSDRYTTVTDRESDWGGTPYAFGSIWNFGGHTPIGANAPDWVEQYPKWRDREEVHSPVSRRCRRPPTTTHPPSPCSPTWPGRPAPSIWTTGSRRTPSPATEGPTGMPPRPGRRSATRRTTCPERTPGARRPTACSAPVRA